MPATFERESQLWVCRWCSPARHPRPARRYFAITRQRRHRLDGYDVRRCPDRQTRSRHRRDRSSTGVRVGVACRVRRRFRVGGESRCVLNEITTSRRAVTQTIAVELYDQGASAIRFPSRLDGNACIALFEGRGAISSEGDPVPLADPPPVQLTNVATRDLALEAHPTMMGGARPLISADASTRFACSCCLLQPDVTPVECASASRRRVPGPVGCAPERCGLNQTATWTPAAETSRSHGVLQWTFARKPSDSETIVGQRDSRPDGS